MSTRTIRAALAVALATAMAVGCGAPPQQTSAPAAPAGGIDRTVLPIAEPAPQRYTELDARNAKPPARFEVKAPSNAPNVVIVLIDDVGFGGPSTFGGPIRTPTMDQLAQGGLRFNNFHTTALCSPTRNALKTGRNHHTVNTGSIMETATAFPGNTGQNPNSVAPLAEMLRLNGYSTGAFGKWHETAAWETSVSGPFDRWPTHQGFDKFYGFIGGETDQWYPLIYDGSIKVEPPKMENYHFTVDMTNQAINWVKAQQSMTPDKPFFVYYAPGRDACAAPRAEGMGRQVQGPVRQGLGPGADRNARAAEEARRHPGQHAAGRAAEGPGRVGLAAGRPAAPVRAPGRSVRRLPGAHRRRDRPLPRRRSPTSASSTTPLFIYIAGDNGTSAEGGFVGMYNEMTYFNGVAEKVEDLDPADRQVGRPGNLPAHGGGLGRRLRHALLLDQAGGVRLRRHAQRHGDPLAAGHQADTGGLRSQFSHVIDIAPTILEAAGLPEPKSVNGTPQTPIEGTSLVYAFNDAKAPERHTTQYFEMFGNRAIYNDGWFARTIHRAPWQTTNLPPLTSDVWELYDVRNDFSLTRNLAAEQGAKLKEMQALFMKEAEKYHVLPIDDRTIERTNPALAGRPDVLGTRTSLTLYEGMQGMLENTFMNIKNRSSKITAELVIPASRANGAILSQGGRFGGWSLYMKDGKPAYTYNFLGLERYTVAAPQALPPGPVTVTLDFVYDGGGAGKGGKATLLVNGKAVAEGRVEKTQPNIFSADETADVGIDNQTPVAEGIGIGAETRFTGRINKITLEVR